MITLSTICSFLSLRREVVRDMGHHSATGEGFYGFINAFLPAGSAHGGTIHPRYRDFIHLPTKTPRPFYRRPIVKFHRLMLLTLLYPHKPFLSTLIEFPIFLQYVLSSYTSIPALKMVIFTLASPPVTILPARILIRRQYTASKACKMVVLTVCKRCYSCSVRRPSLTWPLWTLCSC